MTERGEGFLICTRAVAEKMSSTPAFRHVWRCLCPREGGGGSGWETSGRDQAVKTCKIQELTPSSIFLKPT